MPPPPPHPPRRARYERIAAFLLLVAIGALVSHFLLSPSGQYWTNRDLVRGLIELHPILSPLVFIGVYLLLAILLMPVWWIQFLGGYCFGFFPALLWSQIAASLGATLSMIISRWLLRDWFHRRVEQKLAKLRKLDELMGHNGFLVVMTCRLVHFIPFGLSNYAFGLTAITLMDVFIGTLLGNVIAASLWVGWGTGITPWDWRFLTALAVINLLLLIPIILRYLFPQWFKKLGME